MAAGVPALVSAGIYPGTSNVMAAHICALARQEYDEQGNHAAAKEGEQQHHHRAVWLGGGLSHVFFWGGGGAEPCFDWGGAEPCFGCGLMRW